MLDRNLPDMFFRRVGKFGARARYRHRVGEVWRDVSWNEMAGRVRQLAAALLDAGLAKADRACIVSASRPEWCEADFGILSAGGVSVPVYPSCTPEETAFILWNAELGRDADVRVLIQAGIDERNAKLARYESVKKFAVVHPDFTQEGGELTPSLKLERRVVREKHGAAIEKLYAVGDKE